jgi:hypothetical protein
MDRQNSFEPWLTLLVALRESPVLQGVHDADAFSSI